MGYKIKLIGAYDRFNYGDLLFPIMLKYAVSKVSSKSIEIENYSLVNADFSNYGGLKTRSYREFRKSINEDINNNIVVAGGEVLGASWTSLFACLNYSNYYFQFIGNPISIKLRFNRVFDYLNMPRQILGGKSEYPFLINKNDFNAAVKIFYNSVGGVPANSNLYKRLYDADYIAVREKDVASKLLENNVNSKVVPDSAIILSDIYTDVELANNSFIRDEIQVLPHSYIFQIS